MNKITQADIARELQISRSTVTRVLRNNPSVKSSTRRRVVDYLNCIGYYNQTHFPQKKIIFCYEAKNSVVADMIKSLTGKLLFRKYNIVTLDCRKDKWAFMRELENAAILVFFSIFEEQYFTLAREVNPEIYIIHAFSGGMRCANISIEPDDTTSGRLAASYLYEMGHRDIMMICNKNNETSMQRTKSFLGEFMFRYPDCNVETLFIDGPDPQWEEKFLAALKQRKTLPSAVTCFSCSMQEGILQTFRDLNLIVADDISILSHDNPQDFNANVSRNCDALVFNLQEITRLVEYFIACRPLAADGSRLSISPEIRVEPHGTVAKLPQKSNLKK
jgi:DNA-binding LacI/PurR family transcriptional regulator